MKELEILKGLDRINAKLGQILRILQSDSEDLMLLVDKFHQHQLTPRELATRQHDALTKFHAPPKKSHKKLTEDEKKDIYDTNFPQSGSIIR
jgi:hypothetical protein